MNNREIAGVKVFVSGETYDEYKGTLQEQIENLQSKIDKAINKLEKYGLVDKNGNFNTYLDTIELKELYDDLKEDK